MKSVTILTIALLAVATSACTKQARRNRHLARAARYFQAEQYDRAEIEYLNVLKIPPPDSEAVGRLGLIYHLEGRSPQAYAFLRKAVELQPGNIGLRETLGEECKLLGMPKQAREEAMRMLEMHPDNPQGALLLVETIVNTNQIEETGEKLEAFTPGAKATAGYHLARGALFLRQQDLTNAQAELERALALDPKSSAAQTVLASVYLFRNDPARAQSALRAAAELAPLRSLARLRFAELQVTTGAIEEGAHTVEEVTRKAPDYLPAWNFRARLAFSQHKHDECGALLQQALSRDPANREALLLKGDLLLVKGEIPAALADFERVASLYGRTPQMLYKLARGHLVNSDMAQSVAELNQAIKADPDFTDAIMMLADLSLRRGDTAWAETALTKLIARHPQNFQAHLLLANAYLMQNEPDEAITVYARMAELFPGNPEPALLIGTIFAQQNKTDQARQAFEKALDRAPDYLLALEKLVDLSLIQSDYAAATRRVRRQMERDASQAEPWLLMAKIHWAQAMSYASPEGNAPAARPQLSKAPGARQEADDAEAALLKAISLKPDLSTAYLLLAQIYVAGNKHSQALEKLAGLAKSNDASALMQIGVIQDELKNYPAAQEAYETLLRSKPNFYPALYALAHLYSEKLGKPDQALVVAQTARQLLPYDPFVADTLGWILARRGEYSRALGLIQEAAMKLPGDPEVQFHLGTTHYLMGEEEPARLALEKAAGAKEEFNGKEDAVRRLALLRLNVEKANEDDIANLNKALRENPDDPVALVRFAAIQEAREAFTRAREAYTAALKKYPQNTQILVKLARLEASHFDNREAAIKLAKTAHDLAPEDPEVSATLASLIYQEGDYRWALSLLEGATRKLPNQPELLFQLACASYKLGKVAEAEDALDRALRLQGSFPSREKASRFQTMLAAARTQSALRAAAEGAKNLLTTEPDQVAALMVCALFQQQETNAPAAKQLYERILQYNPLFVPAIRNLAILYAQDPRNDQKAYDLALKAREANPLDQEIARTLGILAYRRAEYSRAVALLKEAAQNHTEDPELLYYLGMAQCRNDERATGKIALQKALGFPLDPKLADDARRVLAQLN